MVFSSEAPDDTVHKVSVMKKRREAMKVCGFFFLLSMFSPFLDANPGIKVKITQKGLDYGIQCGVDLLQQRLKEEIFEDMSGQETYGFSGVDYTVSKIQVNSVEFPNTSVSLIPGIGINLLINDARATVNANWKVRSWLFRSSGKLTVFISGVFLTAIVTASQDNAGHTVLLLESCQGNVGGIDIELDQEAGWMYKYFVNFLEKPTCISLTTNMCPYIGFEIERINAELKQRQVRAQIDSFARVDYSLVNSLSISKASINLDIKGTVYPVGNDTEPPFKPKPFIIPEKNNSMIHIGISEYFLQSASLVYYASGAFDVSIAKELSSYFRLTTKAFGSSIPKVARRYATPYPVILNLKPIAAPVIGLHNDSFVLEAAGSMEVLAVLPNSTTQSMFTLNITAITRASLTIFEQKLIPSLCLDSFHLSLAHSNVGFFKVSLLKNFFSYILRNGVIPAANAKLKEGLRLLETDSMMLVEPVVTVHQAYLLISTDLAYNVEEDQGESEEFFTIDA
ncbi:BPI fold-containing family C protein [Rhineura floridana]|uniref:BPI fold-containing family C protein n=1 Tax=Rhineura floridana TaxID=261503 RepID=UPI002AC84176|nr:BPI fold-containing family C protein [Rhineura floridana]